MLEATQDQRKNNLQLQCPVMMSIFLISFCHRAPKVLVLMTLLSTYY